MGPRLKSPEAILPTRMTLHVPADTLLRFSVLEFPYERAVSAFMEHFSEIFNKRHNKKLPYHLRLPYRQLNDALLSLAPGLVQGFEGDKTHRMVTFTRYEEETAQLPEEFPSQEQIKSLIRHWVERWGQQTDIQPLLQADGKNAWATLIKALDSDPETDWRHNIHPTSLAADSSYENGLAYVVLPALLTALLHNKTMTIQSEQNTYPITWRRVNSSGKNGLYLVSEPIQRQDDYFAYRLDFSVQTQAGYVSGGKSGVWIFAYLSIQRYIGERYRKGDDNRNISIQVGFNRERFLNGDGWDDDTTLIRLGVQKKKGQPAVWDSGVGSLLDDFAVRKLLSPEEILTTPQRYGNYNNSNDFVGDEYYIVFAEGRKFGDERGRGHQILTGTSLRERSQIMEGIISLLDGWLEVSAPFQLDRQNPQNTFALRDHNHMVKTNVKSPAKNASWQIALKTSLASGQHRYLHIVVLHRSPDFWQWAEPEFEKALMGAADGEHPLATITPRLMPPSLYALLNPGELDPNLYWKPKAQKPAGFITNWNRQMKESYAQKRQEWRNFLRDDIEWLPNSRRLVLIDVPDQLGDPPNQRIKAAVRDACNREKVSSQFIIGNFKEDKRTKQTARRLDGNSAGRLKNAVLDLLLRQQTILYAPPREIYEYAAEMNADTAQQLDVIAFCRIQSTSVSKFNYVLSVRLRADGEVKVMLPGDTTRWLSYDAAAHQIGILFSDKHWTLYRDKSPSPLRLNQGQMVDFVHEVLTKRLERPTIAVIEAVGWRNGRGEEEQKHCWTQLRNSDLFQNRHKLRFDTNRVYERSAPVLNDLLAVVRLRMGDETPQYTTASTWTSEELMRDMPHNTGYVDPCVPDMLHYMSVAGLPELQKKQKDKRIVELFKADLKDKPQDEIAIKHPQIIEMVPFFVHPAFQHDEGQRQLCRCIHFLRVSPGFTMGSITLPFNMHLGEKLVHDQLVLLDEED